MNSKLNPAVVSELKILPYGHKPDSEDQEGRQEGSLFQMAISNHSYILSYQPTRCNSLNTAFMLIKETIYGIQTWRSSWNEGTKRSPCQGRKNLIPQSKYWLSKFKK